MLIDKMLTGLFPNDKEDREYLIKYISRVKDSEKRELYLKIANEAGFNITKEEVGIQK